MQKPPLIVLAAGLGSRFGGPKQVKSVDAAGHTLMDFSIYDAKRAGFETVICVITPAMEHDFREKIGDAIARHMEVRYAFQQPDALPPGFSIPEGRTKPWGTGHAVLSAKPLVDGPFAVINADDFYGAEAYQQIYTFLTEEAGEGVHAMVGYPIENTLTEHGQVARGICRTDTDGVRLLAIHERTHIEPRPGGAAYTDDGQHFTFIPAGTIVSMNLWGFGPDMMSELEARFTGFLTDQLPHNPLKGEYFLPWVPNVLMEEKKAQIKVLRTYEKWMGITHPNDWDSVYEAIKRLKTAGQYPDKLWA